MSKKKKVTAPVTYDPGKGRPKEYLAYLNWQEMQELQRINGGNMERGPKGLPSFPPAGAMSGGSAKSPASTSTSKAAGSPPSKSTPSSKMGASSTQSGGLKSSTSGGMKSGPGSTGGAKTPGGVKSATGGGGGGMKSGPGSTGGTKTPGGGGGISVSRPAGVGMGGGVGRDSTRGLGGGAGTTAIGRSDKAAINAVNQANSRAAQGTPALRADRTRVTNVGPMGTPVTGRVAEPGQRIRGAIRAAQRPDSIPGASGVSIPKATVTPTSPGAGGGFGYADSAQRGLMRGSLRSPVGPTSGITAPRDPYGALANRITQRQISEAYKAAVSGYPSAPQGVYGPRAGVGTGYLSSGTPVGPVTGMPSPYSGTVQPRYSAEATLRAYEDAKRASVQAKIQDRVPAAQPATPRGRVAIPGLITEPSLRRPMTSEDAFRQAAAMQNPTSLPISQSLPRPKQIQDRINVVPSPEQSLYTGAGEFGVPAATKQIYDRINVVPSPEQSLYTGRPNVVPSPRQSLYTGRSAGVATLTERRASEVPPYAGAERVLGVENIMSDSGIRKSIPGFTPSAPTVADLVEQYSQYRSPPAIPMDRAPVDRITGPWPGQSAIPVKEAVYRPGKQFADPIADRVAGTYPGPIASPISLTPDGTTVYRTPEGFGVAEPPSFMRESESPPYAGTQGIAAIPVQAPKRLVPGLSRVTNPFAANLGTLTEDLREQITGEYERFRPRTEDSAAGVPGGETPERDVVEEGVEDETPGDSNASPSQGGLTPEQREEAEETVRRGGLGIRVGTTLVGTTLGVPGGLVGGRISKAYQNAVLKKLEDYAAMTNAEKEVAERNNPELIGWANRLGIPSVNDYSVYTSWAERSGLRSSQSGSGRGGDDSRGIADLVNYGEETRTDEEGDGRGDGSSSTSGFRPYIYYEWDLGLNIPSPGDSKYNQYQTYLAERLSAQQAMG